MIRAPLDPATAYGRHPLQPHQLVDRITRTDDAIVLCHFGIPRLDASTWSVTIDGLLRRPLRLTLDALKQYRRVEINSVHECCGSPLEPETPKRRVTNIVWGGVRLADLLADAEPDAAARYLWARGADYGVFAGITCDAYVKDVPLERVADDVLIAYEMNGASLRPEHGFPARLFVPGFYGTNCVKWLTRLTLAAKRADSPFTTRWYSDVVRNAEGQPTGEKTPVWSIAPESVIVSPAPEQTLQAGEIAEIWGWTWADCGVSTVDISTDGGVAWRAAVLEPRVGRTWQRFAASWQPELNGTYELCARATTADGRHQPLSGTRNAVHRVSVHVA
jgi:DMSO/TMAO reductase YedYZ molybdopterin-dependent catalytic subunit